MQRPLTEICYADYTKNFAHQNGYLTGFWSENNTLKISEAKSFSKWQWILLTPVAWVLSPQSCVLFGGHAGALRFPGPRGGCRGAEWLPLCLEFLLVRWFELERVRRRGLPRELERRRLQQITLRLISIFWDYLFTQVLYLRVGFYWFQLRLKQRNRRGKWVEFYGIGIIKLMHKN